ncbi:MAG: tRNA (adenosine(37)-N6)-threonylcarbamoyltransferase complex dimerization subunit type 1 TsaB [Candidatus Brocadiaceae bacterium]
MLGIETSGSIGSVALCDEEEPLASYTFPEGARHARDIMPAVDRLIREAETPKGEVDAVAVSEGPGSFTGLRVGVTCAKALAWALGWKCVGVCSLEVMVQNVARDECGGGCVVCPVLDARRDRVYGAVFRWDDGWRDTTGVLCVRPQALREMLPEGAFVFGSGVGAWREVFADGRFRVGEERLQVGRAEQVARLGAEGVRAGRDVDPVQLMPRYYRVTSPEEKLAREEADG